jgi:hypothetical protein
VFKLRRRRIAVHFCNILVLNCITERRCQLLRPHSVGDRWMNVQGKLVVWYWQRKAKVLGQDLFHCHNYNTRHKLFWGQSWNSRGELLSHCPTSRVSASFKLRLVSSSCISFLALDCKVVTSLLVLAFFSKLFQTPPITPPPPTVKPGIVRKNVYGVTL